MEFHGLGSVWADDGDEGDDGEDGLRIGGAVTPPVGPEAAQGSSEGADALSTPLMLLQAIGPEQADGGSAAPAAAGGARPDPTQPLSTRASGLVRLAGGSVLVFLLLSFLLGEKRFVFFWVCGGERGGS